LEDSLVRHEVDVSTLKRWFEESEDAFEVSNKKASRDRDYYDGKQLTDEELRVLHERKQPPAVYNYIRSRVEFLQGLEKKERRDPRAYPRTPDDEAAANAFTDGLRFAVEESDYQFARSKAWENLIIEGVGGVEISAFENARGDYDFKCEPIPWERLFIDPHSTRTDATDAKYVGISRWMDRDDMESDYGSDGGASFDVAKKSVVSQTGRYADRPANRGWFDAKRERCRVVTIWWRDRDGWNYCVHSGDTKFMGGPSPYMAKDGESLCPIVLDTAYIDRENNRYGVIRDLIDPQDTLNKRTSKATHIGNTRQLRVTENGNPTVDADTARLEASRPDGVIPEGYEVVQTSDMFGSMMNLMQSDIGFISQAGPNRALLGKGVESQSGTAIEAQQSGGMIEMGSLLDSLRRIDRRVFRLFGAFMQQFWTAERWIRITDDPMSPKYVGLNVEQADEFGNVVGVENNVAEMEVDIIIEDAPNVVSLEGPAYEQMMQVLQMAGQMPPQIVRIAIEANPALPLAKKRKLIEVLDQMQQGQQQQPPQPDPVQQQMMQAGVRKTEAEVNKIEADAMRSAAQAQESMARAQQPAMAY
jgi:hypothetical protein